MAEKKVMVVDDEIHIVHVVAVKLRNNGYEVVTADNGATGFELAIKERPDIIVADYQMPIMSGLEMIEKLRAEDLTKSIPVIMLTARSFAVEDERKNALGISSCLSKPFSPKELLRNIEDVLCQSRMVVNE